MGGVELLLLFVVSNLIVLFIGALFFIRKKIDVYSVAFIGSLMYFLPALIPGEVVYVETLIFYWAYLASLLAFAIFFDRVFEGRKKIELSGEAASFMLKLCMAFFLLSVVFLLIQINIYGISGFLAAKQDQIRNGYIATLYSVFVLLGFSLSFYCNSRWGVGVFAVLLVFMFVSGSRTQLVISFFCVLLLWGEKGRSAASLVSPKLLGMVLVLFVIGVYGKLIYSAVPYTYAMGGSYLDNLAYLFSQSSGGIYKGITNTEPFWIDNMFGGIIKEGLNIDSSYLLKLPLQFLPFSSALGGDLHYFSNSVKAQYFSDWSATAGVGATFWGEGYANFQVAGLV